MFSTFKVTVVAALSLGYSLASGATLPPPENHVGSATLYHPSGLSACGTTPQDTDLVAGVSKDIFAEFGNTTTGNPVCGRFIVVNSPDGKSVRAAIQEQCASCATNDILLSGGAFSTLADPVVGIIQNVNWFFFLK